MWNGALSMGTGLSPSCAAAVAASAKARTAMDAKAACLKVASRILWIFVSYNKWRPDERPVYVFQCTMSCAARANLAPWPHCTLYGKGKIMTRGPQGKFATPTHMKPGDTVAVSGATGGVGSITVQLARRAGAEVIGIAGPANHEWLAAHGIKPVAYGEELAD